MKQPLLFQKTNVMYCIAQKKRNASTPLLYRLTLALLVGLIWIPFSRAQNIIIDGSSHAANAIGTVQDLTLPIGNTVKSISFTLVGGDGGTAEVHDVIYYPVPPFSTNISFKANGGGGATTTATVAVGNAVGEIPPGSIIRFVEGAIGESGSSAGVVGNGFSYGGGGGGSAVLFDPPGPTGWTLLAVAGGGGGAYQGMALYLEVDHDNGQGGRSASGTGAGGAGNIGFGGGGGGANSNGGGVLCVDFDFNNTTAGEGGAGGSSVGYGGDSDGCLSFTWRNGGAGYGGGGAGAGVGGGGGGYSGGAAGAATDSGNGGGSYVNSLATISNKTDGGTDGSPDHGSITYQVTLNQPPVAQCKNATIYLNSSGQATIASSEVNNGSYDPDGTIEGTSVAPGSFTCSNIGPNQVTLTVTDNSGAMAQCMATVTVLDTIAPSAVCQNITVFLDGSGNTTITGADLNGGSTDNCTIASLLASPSSFTCADVGSNIVTLTVTDDSGNFSTCNSTVTVQDTVSPVAVCKDITIQLDANGNASISGVDIDNGSNDACGIDSLDASKTAFTCADVGANTVTLTVTDNNGNFSTCSSTVTVQDTVPPVALCKNITIQLDEQGEASIVPTDIDDGSNDACGIALYGASKLDFNCDDLGNNNVLLTVTDVNGNSATCNANVRVEDNIAPIVRTRDITVVLDKDGEGYVLPDMINDGSTDNCTIVSMWLDGVVEYDCGNTGVHEVVLHVRDQSGNVGSYNAFVTVKFFEPDFKNIHDVANGDTIHVVDCQAPWDISRNDLDYETIKKHGTVTTNVYKEELPENAPWGMYAVWRYEYVVKDACYHTYRFNYYLAFYDLEPPIYSCFPHDTIVATSAEVPPVEMKVKIIDVCQYVVWDTVMTMPVLDLAGGDTIGFTRRWMARDPSGHESFRDQMIWLGSGDRKQYGLITGRIANEDHIRRAKFAGEAGTNGLPISLYRLDEDTGTRTWENSWTTGDWMGAQGRYYFVPEHPGSYQVKIDTSICLIDTLKFDKDLWSDTLEITAGESLDQGWIITHPCTGVDVIETLASRDARPDRPGTRLIIQDQMGNNDWKLYPNPASGYLRLEIKSDQQFNYRLYDTLGRSVKSGVYERGQIIDIHGLNTGVYHLQLLDKEVVLGTKKVLIMQ